MIHESVKISILSLFFMCGVRECSDFILLHVAVQFSQHHLLKCGTFLYCIFLPPLIVNHINFIRFFQSDFFFCQNPKAEVYFYIHSGGWSEVPGKVLNKSYSHYKADHQILTRFSLSLSLFFFQLTLISCKPDSSPHVSLSSEIPPPHTSFLPQTLTPKSKKKKKKKNEKTSSVLYTWEFWHVPTILTLYLSLLWILCLFWSSVPCIFYTCIIIWISWIMC